MTNEELKKELKEALLEQFKDTRLDMNAVEFFIQKWLSEKINCERKVTTYKHNYAITVYFDGYSIFSVECKKQRGDIHHPWYGKSYYDWYFKDFEIMTFLVCDTLEERIAEIKNDVKTAEDRKKEREEIAKKIREYMKKEYPDKDKYELRAIADCLSEKAYELFDED